MTSEPKNKGGRPKNTKRAELEQAWGVSARRVQQVIKEMGIDNIADIEELRVIEKRVVIALRSAQADRHRHDLERQRRLDTGELIPADFAIAKYVGALLELKAQLANLPDRLCAKLNPDDPEFARRILQEELATISAAVVAKAES
jgi:hypothetical protein